MYLVGKLGNWQEDAFSLPAGSTGSSLIYLHDELSNRRFLVDTGASISVFPSPTSDKSSGMRLITAAPGPELYLYVSEHGIVPGRSS